MNLGRYIFNTIVQRKTVGQVEAVVLKAMYIRSLILIINAITTTTCTDVCI